MTDFKPTHILHYAVNTKCHKYFPEGVPVMQGSNDESGLVEWLSDIPKNNVSYVAGHTLPHYLYEVVNNKDLFNYVTPIE